MPFPFFFIVFLPLNYCFFKRKDSKMRGWDKKVLADDSREIDGEKCRINGQKGSGQKEKGWKRKEGDRMMSSEMK